MILIARGNKLATVYRLHNTVHSAFYEKYTESLYLVCTAYIDI